MYSPIPASLLFWSIPFLFTPTTDRTQVHALLKSKLYHLKTVNLINVPGFDLFGYALVARSTNYVLGRGAAANEGLYDGVLSCARANDEDSHSREFTARG